MKAARSLSTLQVALIAACALVFSVLLVRMLRGLREGFAQGPGATQGPAYNVVVAPPRGAQQGGDVLAADTMRASVPITVPDLPAAATMGDDLRFNQLDLGQCNASCCGIGRGTNLTCQGGCVCVNNKNADVLASRGGNRSRGAADAEAAEF